MKLKVSTTAVASLVIVAISALSLYLMGQPLLCTCGTVKLWEGVVNSSGNSQHLSDWYTFSHIIHGFLFYGLLRLVARRLPIGLRLVLALMVEASWEIVENTDFIINRYREATVSLNYFGDAVINSTSDIVFMIVGFLLAARLPVGVTVAVAIGLELFTGFMIRDNLTLNVLMLTWPLDAVRQWQAGGG